MLFPLITSSSTAMREKKKKSDSESLLARRTSHCELVMRGTTDCHRKRRLTCSKNEKKIVSNDMKLLPHLAVVRVFGAVMISVAVLKSSVEDDEQKS
jgi:hypothetical protein